MEALLNFAQPLDVSLLDSVVNAVYMGTSKVQVRSAAPED